MNTCHTCSAPAAWRDQQGRCWCSSHLPTNGQFRSLRRAEPDILERLESQERQPGDYCDSAECDTVKELAAAEIRRLRAALAGHALGDGKQQQRHGREEGSMAEIKRGCIARCSLGMLGVVTSNIKQMTRYGSLAWIGVQLSSDRAGDEWCSRNPEFVAESIDAMLAASERKETT